MSNSIAKSFSIGFLAQFSCFSCWWAAINYEYHIKLSEKFHVPFQLAYWKNKPYFDVLPCKITKWFRWSFISSSSSSVCIPDFSIFGWCLVQFLADELCIATRTKVALQAPFECTVVSFWNFKRILHFHCKSVYSSYKLCHQKQKKKMKKRWNVHFIVIYLVVIRTS